MEIIMALDDTTTTSARCTLPSDHFPNAEYRPCYFPLVVDPYGPASAHAAATEKAQIRDRLGIGVRWDLGHTIPGPMRV